MSAIAAQRPPTIRSQRRFTVEECRLKSSFEKLQTNFRQERYADCLGHLIAFWARPSDRRLPLTFLDRPLKELLAMRFEDLLASHGVGYKKISSLLTLLARVLEQDTLAEHSTSGHVGDDGNGAGYAESRSLSTHVTEAQWSTWRDTVKRHGLGQIMLGRVAPTLQALPTVIWTTRLDNYVPLTVAEIRQLKTHGEKRLRVVLEIFSIVHDALGRAESQQHLAVRLVPRFVPPLEGWITAALTAPETPTHEDLRQSMAVPLLDQIRVDLGEDVAALAAERLGIDGLPKSVRQMSHERRITRARIYQLLDDCVRVMQVRWPEGKWLLLPLETKLLRSGANNECLQLFCTLRDGFFPQARASDQGSRSRSATTLDCSTSYSSIRRPSGGRSSAASDHRLGHIAPRLLTVSSTRTSPPSGPITPSTIRAL